MNFEYEIILKSEADFPKIYRAAINGQRMRLPVKCATKQVFDQSWNYLMEWQYTLDK